MNLDPLSAAALVVAVIAVIRSFRKRDLSLTEIAIRAVGYAEQMGDGPYGKLSQALEAAKKLDAGDNGLRDYTDTQLRIAIEAELARATK